MEIPLIMASKRRDDFSRQTIEILAKRVTYCCSNPECRKATIGPNVNKNKATSIGVAAHIKAAAPGGPRYDENMTSEERSDISNGIWLCQSCSKLIDANPERYPVNLLLEWKELAEQTSQRAIESDGTFNPDNIFSMAIEDKLVGDLEINKDEESTVLTRKMKDGEFDTVSILNAKEAKLHALSVIKVLKTTQAGKIVLNQIYSDVKMTIMNNIYMKKTYGDLLKEDMSLINVEMNKLLDKYRDKPCVDLQFLMGLLYIATSNCAMLWKYGSELNETDN